MLTFNLRAPNGNYYRGHEPSNDSSNCWTDTADKSLTLSLGQARGLINAVSWMCNLEIVIALSSIHIEDDAYRREIFCLKDGRWFDYKDREEQLNGTE